MKLFSSSISIIFFRTNRFFSMATSVLIPDEQVRGMKDLNKDGFLKTVSIPCLLMEKETVSKILPVVKPYLLKLENFKAIQTVNVNNIQVFLNPDKVKGWKYISNEASSKLVTLGITPDNFKFENVTLTYDNYSYDTVLKSVLPKNADGFSSFTIIGHILHVNLRDHLIPYKELIGQVLLEKVKKCKTVVNKIDIIDNTYRNFKMELLSGENRMQTSVKENGCLFEFDFSTVYWNSRLCTEHERVIQMVKAGDLFIDIFAGVGPFSIPIAKKKCCVHANDLNPESFKWLNHNIQINKVKENYIKTYNKEGKDFITENVRILLLENLNKHNIHIAMNLPGLAVQFIPYFFGLISDNRIKIINLPLLHVYCFAKGSETNANYKNIAKELIINQSNVPNIEDKIIDVFEVRTVSNFKKMMKVTLKLDEEILLGSYTFKRKNNSEEIFTSKIMKSQHGKKETQ